MLPAEHELFWIVLLHCLVLQITRFDCKFILKLEMLKLLLFVVEIVSKNELDGLCFVPLATGREIDTATNRFDSWRYFSWVETIWVELQLSWPKSSWVDSRSWFKVSNWCLSAAHASTTRLHSCSQLSHSLPSRFSSVLNLALKTRSRFSDRSKGNKKRKTYWTWNQNVYRAQLLGRVVLTIIGRCRFDGDLTRSLSTAKSRDKDG